MKFISVPVDVAETIIDYWRQANEAPGGISPYQAIEGMREAVWELEQARRAAESPGDFARRKGYEQGSEKDQEARLRSVAPPSARRSPYVHIEDEDDFDAGP